MKKKQDNVLESDTKQQADFPCNYLIVKNLIHKFTLMDRVHCIKSPKQNISDNEPVVL